MDQIHTTPMGAMRIARNLGMGTDASWAACMDVIRHGDCMQRGKNYYATKNGITVTINAGSCTVITAHKH